MVGTEIGAVDPGIVRRQQLDQATLHGLVSSRAVQAARDPRLVGDGDHEPARLIQLMNRLARACEQTDFAGLVQESRVLHDGSVPVQEDGAAAGVSHRARPAPRVTASSSSGKMVRGSSTTRWSAMRAMMGGSFARNL